MAPTPKPAGQRRRRNVDQPQVRALPAEGRRGKPPPLPTKRPSWLKKTREQWAELWRSPMATRWLPADLPALERWALMQDAVNRGELSAMFASELRQLEDRFGLSQLARMRLFVEVAAPGEVKPEEEAQPAKPARGRIKLRAV